MRFLSALLVVITMSSWAGAAEELTFLTLKSLSQEQALERYSGKTVTIRGFVYRSPAGATFLAATPNVKSCCLGTAKTVSQQITLTEPLAPSALVTTVIGLFVVAPQYNDEGTLVELYRLTPEKH